MSTDCIVLRIDEYSHSDFDNLSPVKSMYILYDVVYDSFVIRGKRGETYGNSCYYSFSCNKATPLVEMIRVAFDSTNRCNLTVLKYNDLPYDTEYISYDLLNRPRYNSSAFISGYENVNFEKFRIKKILKMLRHVLNEYDESADSL